MRALGRRGGGSVSRGIAAVWTNRIFLQKLGDLKPFGYFSVKSIFKQ